VKGKFRKILIYIIFSSSVLYGIYFHVFSDEKSKAEKRQVNHQTAQTADVKQASLAPDQNNIPYGWGINPFHSREHFDSESTDNAGEQANTSPGLTGIAYYLNEPGYVIIDNKVLRAGEAIGGWKVLRISKDYVKIGNPNGVKTLTLGEEL